MLFSFGDYFAADPIQKRGQVRMALT